MLFGGLKNHNLIPHKKCIFLGLLQYQLISSIHSGFSELCRPPHDLKVALPTHTVFFTKTSRNCLDRLRMENECRKWSATTELNNVSHYARIFAIQGALRTAAGDVDRFACMGEGGWIHLDQTAQTPHSKTPIKVASARVGQGWCQCVCSPTAVASGSGSVSYIVVVVVVVAGWWRWWWWWWLAGGGWWWW